MVLNDKWPVCAGPLLPAGKPDAELGRVQIWLTVFAFVLVVSISVLSREPDPNWPNTVRYGWGNIRVLWFAGTCVIPAVWAIPEAVERSAEGGDSTG
jgi:hypothetical protein